MIEFSMSDGDHPKVIGLWKSGQLIGFIHPTETGFRFVTKYEISQMGPLVDASGERNVQISIQVKP